MKRILVLTAGIVFGSAAAASAYSWVDGYIGATVTNLSSTRNQIDIYLIDNGSYPGGVMAGIEGTWDLTNPPLPNPHHVPYDNPPGASFYLGGTDIAVPASGYWKKRTTNTYQPAAPESYVNFDSYTAGATWAKSGTLPAITSFTGSWYTDVAQLSPSGYNLLATMYVDNGSWVHFNGQAGFIISGSPSILPLEFTVPEPGTLVLLGMAGLALLAYAWRVASMKARCL